MESDSGGVNAPRWPNGNIDWDKIYSEYVAEIIQNQVAPNTNRGIMYILESKGVLKKTDYKALTHHLVEWRKDGRIPWDAIADGSGRGVYNDFVYYKGPQTFIQSYIDSLENCGNNYQALLKGQWRWFGQPHYVEFWSEKHAIVATIAAHVKEHYVRVAFNRGNPGWGYMRQNYFRLLHELSFTDFVTGREIQRPKKGIHVFYLGDSDKYGHGMDRQIIDQLKHFDQNLRLKLLPYLDFKRIAVLPEQIEEFGIPVELEDEDKGKGIEIDALNAFNEDAFRDLLLGHIIPYFDNDIQRKLLEMNSPKEIDKLVRHRVKFL